MDISEAQQKRHELQRAILHLIHQFERETGLHVVNVQACCMPIGSRDEMDTLDEPEKIVVDVKL